VILFMYGKETWSVHEKLQQVIAKARGQGIDDANTSRLDAEATPAALRDAVMAVPFIAKQRLVVVRDWLLEKPAADAEALAKLLPDVPESTILVVTEFGEPDKRRTAFKALTKQAGKTWQFAPLDAATAGRWVGRRAAALGASIKPAAATHLVNLAGSDLWTLSTELEKLASAADGEITTALIDELVAEATPSDIFGLVDAVGRRDAKTALTQYHRLLGDGEPPLRIMAMVVRQFRLLLGAGALLAGGKPESAVAKELHVHPFVAKKAAAQSKSFTERELRDYYDRLSELDHQIKTGRREPEAGLELFIMEAC
jgi:DNA polymerase-3 subunit delta